MVSQLGAFRSPNMSPVRVMIYLLASRLWGVEGWGSHETTLRWFSGSGSRGVTGVVTSWSPTRSCEREERHVLHTNAAALLPYTHTHTHTHTHTTNWHTHTHQDTHTHPTQTYTHTHAYTHPSQTHTHTCIHTCLCMHTLVLQRLAFGQDKMCVCLPMWVRVCVFHYFWISKSIKIRP